MNPSARLAASLLAALALWWPTMTACLRGDVQLTVAAGRFALALAMAWAGFCVLSALVRSYHQDASPQGSEADEAPRRPSDGAQLERRESRPEP